MPQVGVLHGGVKYIKHGFGCAVHLKGGEVDFDSLHSPKIGQIPDQIVVEHWNGKRDIPM
jgi:hypothetical protein